MSRGGGGGEGAAMGRGGEERSGGYKDVRDHKRKETCRRTCKMTYVTYWTLICSNI
jgi:hypothetical protein